MAQLYIAGKDHLDPLVPTLRILIRCRNEVRATRSRPRLAKDADDKLRIICEVLSACLTAKCLEIAQSGELVEAVTSTHVHDLIPVLECWRAQAAIEYRKDKKTCLTEPPFPNVETLLSLLAHVPRLPSGFRWSQGYSERVVTHDMSDLADFVARNG